MDLTDEVREIMAIAFGVDERDIPDDVTQQRYSAWTSLAHVTLILSLEECFGTSFSMDEMTWMVSLARISAVLEEREVA